MQVVRALQAPNVSDQQVDSKIQIHCFLKCSNVCCEPPGKQPFGTIVCAFYRVGSMLWLENTFALNLSAVQDSPSSSRCRTCIAEQVVPKFKIIVS